MPDKNDEILLDAVSRGVAIVLSLPSAGMSRDHKSRFLCELEGGILIASPHSDAVLINDLIERNAPCGVSFNSGAFKIVFTSPIRRSVEAWQLNDDTTVGALLLGFPAEIKVTQRRSNYRVDIGPNSDVSVRVWRISKSESLSDTPASTKEIRAQIRDMSTGGMGVKLIGKDNAPPKISAEDRLRVALEYNGTSLIIEGKMAWPPATPTGNVMITGIQFKKLEGDLEGRQTLSRLMRIVGELQREELRRMRLGLAKKTS
ncbi:MAG: PilZ domain-containing protein [Tepidisphaeraceae bacterium]|jgi:c-di-GMP-binding flagellar brake protein YcgR